jgi:hypothetical protein
VGLKGQGIFSFSKATLKSSRLKLNPLLTAFAALAESTANLSSEPKTQAQMGLLWVDSPIFNMALITHRSKRGGLTSSSSSLHRSSPRIVSVLFLIAMDEQTVSLILPYQRSNGLPQNSPELSQPTAGFGAALVLYIFGEGKISFPGMGLCVCVCVCVCVSVCVCVCLCLYVCLGASSSLWILES